jgi:hypothetical protein
LANKNFEYVDPVKDVLELYLGKEKITYSFDGDRAWPVAAKGYPLSWHLLCPESIWIVRD